jgi:hypothetical protein
LQDQVPAHPHLRKPVGPCDGSREIQVFVAVPHTAEERETDVAVIRATGSGGHAETRLTTGVLWRRTYLPLVTKNRP